VLLGGVEVHQLDHAQVVERANNREHDRDDGEPDLADLHHRPQDRELGVEAGQRRYTRHREHQKQHHQREPRAALVEAAEVVQILRLDPAPAEQDDHTERARRDQRIDDDVEHRRGVALGRARQHAQQDETDVRDGRIRQHALEAGLGDGDHIAERERQHREHRQDDLPVTLQHAQALDQQAQKQRHRGHLGRRAEIQRDRGGRALVDVRQPGVERHRAELEADADEDEHHAEHRPDLIDAVADEVVVDVDDLERAGHAVDQRHAVEQHAGGQRAQHEVLHRRLAGALGVAVERDQRVLAKRQQFKAEIDGEHAVAGNHDQHAQQTEQPQHEVFAVQQAPVGQIGS
jgi:hypothetical protein